LIHRQSEASTHALVILDPDSGRPTGITSYLRIDPANGVVEIGWVLFSPLLQRTRAATEALSLQIDYAFQLGYRRVEWKCDSLNAPSRSAAERLGFQYEGTFRQAVVTKGRNRDTTWYSLIDREWPAVRAAHQRWLDPVNFLPDGRQILRLSELTHSVHTVRT
jgi:RimJ/RimL family protein N-acetyltransferase